MATKELVTKVWIEPGCIVCDACETTAPDVFEVLEDTCIIRPAALEAEFNKPRTETIIEAAEECPVEVIKFETVEVDEADAPAQVASGGGEEAPAEAESAPEAAATPDAGTSTPAPETAAAKSETKHETRVETPVGASDPAIQALLRATTSRGGVPGMQRGGTESTPAVKALRSKKLDDLPPDARYGKVLEAAKETKSSGKLSRREAALVTAAGVGWAATTVSGLVSVGALQRYMMPNVLEEPDPRVRVGTVSKYAELPVGGVSEDFKPEGIWLVRLENEVAALSIICTHLGCIPNWLESERKFKCPCHGSGFMQNGINFEGPAPRPLERFKISVEDGVVVVDRSKKYQQEKGEWSNPDSYLSV